MLVIFMCVGGLYLLTSPRSSADLCLRHVSAADKKLNVVYIPSESCYGFHFSQTESVSYKVLNKEYGSTLSIYFEGELKKLDMILSDNERKIDSQRQYTSMKKSEVSSSNAATIFDSHIGLMRYTFINQSPKVSHFHYFNTDDNPRVPFYIRCNKLRNKSLPMNCSVRFSYENAVWVYASVSYQDLKGAVSKVEYMNDLLNSLMQK